MIGEWLEQIAAAQVLLWQEFLPAWCAALVAAVCLPVIGVHVAFRGQSMTALAIPQVSFAGMALVLVIPALGLDEHGEPSAPVLLVAAILGALLGSLAAARGRGERASIRVGGVFVLAVALTEVARALSPVGETRLEPLLHGEILGLNATKALLASLLMIPACLTLLAHRSLTFAAAFPEAAAAAGISPTRESRRMALLLGAAVTLGTVTLGPLLTTALLLLPAALAGLGARTASGMLQSAVGLGLCAALTGSILAVLADLPMGAAITLACAVIGGLHAALRHRSA